jgi:hypothetical protein
MFSHQGFPMGGGGVATPADYHGSPAWVWVWEPAITSPGFLTRDSHRGYPSFYLNDHQGFIVWSTMVQLCSDKKKASDRLDRNQLIYGSSHNVGEVCLLKSHSTKLGKLGEGGVA